MKPEEIIRLVEVETASNMDMSLRDIDMLKRFFLKKFCAWMSLHQIGAITGVGRYTVVSSVKAVNMNNKFTLVKHVITEKIQSYIKKQLKHSGMTDKPKLEFPRRTH